MHFLETFKPLHHIFTFFSFQNTYSDDLPINIMHLYLPCPSWYLYDRSYSVSMVHSLLLRSLSRRHSQPSCGWWWASPPCRHGTVALFFLMAWYGGFACIGVGAVNGAKQGKGGQFWPFVSTVCVFFAWLSADQGHLFVVCVRNEVKQIFFCWHGLHVLLWFCSIYPPSRYRGRVNSSFKKKQERLQERIPSTDFNHG